MKNLVRLSLFEKAFYVGTGAEVYVNRDKIEFLSSSGEFVFCEGVKLFGGGYYDSETRELFSAKMVEDKGWLVEQFVSENPDLNSKIVSFLRAYPESMDVVTGDDGFSFDVTPEKWLMLNTFMALDVFDDTFAAANIGEKLAAKFMEYTK